MEYDNPTVRSSAFRMDFQHRPGSQRVGTHSLRRTKATFIYRRTRNLRAVQLLLGHRKIESTVRYLGIEVDDALAIAEQVDVRAPGQSALSCSAHQACPQLGQQRKFHGRTARSPVDPSETFAAPICCDAKSGIPFEWNSRWESHASLGVDDKSPRDSRGIRLEFGFHDESPPVPSLICDGVFRRPVLSFPEGVFRR